MNDGGLGDVAVRQVKKVSCEDCFFRKNMLCALDLDEACPTFRPDHPEAVSYTHLTLPTILRV